MRSPDLHLAAVQLGALLRDRGPMVWPRVVAMLRARGLSEHEAQAVVRFCVGSGILRPDPADPDTLCSRR